jgi:hypothetical protein
MPAGKLLDWLVSVGKSGVVLVGVGVGVIELVPVALGSGGGLAGLLATIVGLAVDVWGEGTAGGEAGAGASDGVSVNEGGPVHEAVTVSEGGSVPEAWAVADGPGELVVVTETVASCRRSPRKEPAPAAAVESKMQNKNTASNTTRAVFNRNTGTNSPFGGPFCSCSNYTITGRECQKMSEHAT